jgi:hypothetical protein
MTASSETVTHQPDPAGVFAAALSLWEALHKAASGEADLNLSEAYNGLDQLMREIMRIASDFERWACANIDFSETSEVWPYFLEDKFGQACLGVIMPTALASLEKIDLLRVAMCLRLPIKIKDSSPVPVMIEAINPTPGAGFQKFRIQSVRNLIEEDSIIPYTCDDDPTDESFGSPYLALYGIDEHGLLEHIADQTNFSDAVSLLRKLAPGVTIPTTSLLAQKTDRQPHPRPPRQPPPAPTRLARRPHLGT